MEAAHKPITEKPSLCPELLDSIQQDSFEHGQVILHIRYANPTFYGSLIRIWKSSFLIEHETKKRSKLIHAENISIYPTWTEIPPLVNYEFTLIFTGLSKGCHKFDFVEIIPQTGGFSIPNIERNTSDVYRLKLVEV